ncbi:Putative secreted protein [Xanthomonas translucens pv. graminis ART-Xtg29]|nr:Putative secreted protein [Xanthomonas translucens pv. graminis ART-Xtg29]
MLDAQWQYQLEHHPEFASIIGDTRYNDRWSDYSPAALQAERQATADVLKRFEAIDGKALSAQDQLSLQMMLRQLRDRLEAIALKNDEMPLEPVGGIQLTLPGYAQAFPFVSVKDYEDYIKRLQAIPALLDQVVALSRAGAKDGLVQPKYLLERIPAQVRAIAAPAGADSPFALPLKSFPDAVPAAERTRLRAAMLAAIDQQVRPAYARLADFVADEYAPQGRAQEGLWSLPDGERRYRYAIHTQTTTDKSPEQIHQIGLAEVARIEGEMSAIASQLGYADLAALRKAVAHDRKFFASSREQILQRYRDDIAQMQPQLPKLFGHLPKTPLEVRSMAEFRSTAPGAEYWQSDAQGSKPALVMVNTSDYAQRTLVNIEATAYHEGVPGHHLQISLAQSLPLPPFRQQSSYNAYVEGWALYAERLGKDVGFYKDPYSDYGRLAGELLRANRLVLDTGVHYKRWSRQQMIDFFHAHPSDDEPSIQAETDRYILWPGQALGYKLGELDILALREQAKRELGARFDIRAFHDQILGGGAMPLDLLDARIDAWIAQAEAGASATPEKPQ